MIKVRLLAGALPALAALTACSEATQEDVAISDHELNEVAAGAGEIAVHGTAAQYRSTTGGDEFIRTGEQLTTSLAFDMAVDAVAAHDDALASALRADPSKLTVVPRITFVHADGTQSESRLAALVWQADAQNGTFATSAAFVVPKGTKRLVIEHEATAGHGGIPQTTMVLGAHGIAGDFAVFGAFVPSKLALFDSIGAQKRTRILEGGGIVPGARLTLDVTDWRLDTVVDKSTLDLRVGKKQSGNRFGPAIVDAEGMLEYEVGAAISFDDGATYQGIGLSRTPSVELLGSDTRRFVHGTTIDVPRDAHGNVKLALHVKAFVRMPESGIIDPRYAPGERVFLKEVWDKDGDVDHTLRIAAR